MRDPEHQFFPNDKIQVITKNENIETIKKELHDEREKASLSILDELNQIANKMKPKNADKQGNENERLRTTFGPVEEKQKEDIPPTKISKKGTLSRESSK